MIKCFFPPHPPLEGLEMLMVDVVVQPNRRSSEVWVNNQPIGVLYNMNQCARVQCHHAYGSCWRGWTPHSGKIQHTNIKTWCLRCYRSYGFEEEWGVRGGLTIQELGNCGTTSDFCFLWGSRLQKYHSRVGIAITCVIPPPSRWRWFRSCPDYCFVQNQLEPRIWQDPSTLRVNKWHSNKWRTKAYKTVFLAWLLSRQIRLYLSWIKQNVVFSESFSKSRTKSRDRQTDKQTDR